MVASNPRLRDTDKSRRRIDHAGESAPIAVQIAGADPRMMAEAARYNVERGAQIVDINMGCPAKKVCNAAAGSALLADEPLVAAILDAVVARGRRARDAQDPHRAASGRAQRARHRAHRARTPASPALTVHGRTRACAFVGAVEYDTIAAVKRAVSIPGDRQRRRRHARGRARGARAHRRRRAHDRARGAGPAMDLPRDRALLRDGRAPAAADGGRGTRADRRASGRSLRVLRRGNGRAHRAQASRLVHGGPGRRGGIPARDVRRRDDGGAGRGRRRLLRTAGRHARAAALSTRGRRGDGALACGRHAPCNGTAAWGAEVLAA